MYRYPFAVGNTAYCCWEHDLPERNEQFLAGIDCEYFWYVVHRHLDALDGDDRQRAALALRASYHHGVETLFSFLGALAQAPDCVAAWLPKCSTPDLRCIVRGFTVGAPLVTQRGIQRISLADLAKVVHQFCWVDEQPPSATAERFARAWMRFAHEFLEERNSAEYNSLKHGFRVHAGGFALRVGLEEQYGVPAPEASMQTIGSSEFGTSFLLPQPVVADDQSRHHFRIRHSALNWSIEAVIQKLQLVSFSINNVVGALRCLAGAPPNTIRFLRPEDSAAFEQPWRWHVGVHASDFDLVIDSQDVDPVSRATLLQELQARHPTDAA